MVNDNCKNKVSKIGEDRNCIDFSGAYVKVDIFQKEIYVNLNSCKNSLKNCKQLTAGRAKNEIANTEKQDAMVFPIHVTGTMSP